MHGAIWRSFLIDIIYKLSGDIYSHQESASNFLVYKVSELPNSYPEGEECNMPEKPIATYTYIGNGYGEDIFIKSKRKLIAYDTKIELLDIIGLEFDRNVLQFSDSILGIVISINDKSVIIRTFEEHVSFLFYKRYIHNTCENFNKQYAQLLEMKEQYKDLI
jgi:hypothetical protein